MDRPTVLRHSPNIPKSLALGFITALALLGCASNPVETSSGQVSTPTQVHSPTMDVAVAYYVPGERKLARAFVPPLGGWLNFGLAVQAGVEKEGPRAFGEFQEFSPVGSASTQYVVVLEPTWSSDRREIGLQLNYRVVGSDGTEVMSDRVESALGIDTNDMETRLASIAASAAEMAFSRMRARLVLSKPLAVPVQMGAFDLNSLVDRKQPAKTGTAAFISGDGYLLTAAHVVKGCIVTEVRVQEELRRAELVGQSTLLDLALMKVATSVPQFISLRRPFALELGEPVVTVGYPLQGMLDSSPNMTFGNVSSTGALTGSLGLFQFTAPIQPGSSGGPIVSETGELLGIVNSTMNLSSLVEKNVVPQNVNFGLKGEYIQQFLDHVGVNLKAEEMSPSASPVNAGRIALTAATPVFCYQ